MYCERRRPYILAAATTHSDCQLKKSCKRVRVRDGGGEGGKEESRRRGEGEEEEKGTRKSLADFTRVSEIIVWVWRAEERRRSSRHGTTRNGSVINVMQRRFKGDSKWGPRDPHPPPFRPSPSKGPLALLLLLSHPFIWVRR